MGSIVTEFAPDPHAVEAEQALIGALLVNNDVYDRVHGLIDVDDFYDPIHQDIWTKAGEFIRSGRTATAVTLQPVFAAHEGMAEIGGAAYLARLVGAAVSIFNVKDYAGTIRGCAVRRAMIRRAEDLARDAADFDLDEVEIASRAEAAMSVINDRARPTANRAKSAMRIAATAIDRMTVAYQSGAPLGLMTGIQQLDEATGGLLDGEAWTIAGRPSMGKTAISGQICMNVAKQGHPTLFMSMEMDDDPIAHRLISSIIRGRPHALPYSAMRSPEKYTEDQFKEIIMGAQDLEGMPLRFTPPTLRSLAGLRSEARLVQKEMQTAGDRLRLICVDYLQRIDAEGRTDYERISAAMAGMKTMATEIGCPVLVLAQIGRAAESRTYGQKGEAAIPRPQMSDLKGSGNIEEDSDGVILIHRNDYYLDRMQLPRDEVERSKIIAAREKHKGRVSLMMPKFRSGEVGEFQVRADLAYNTILPPEQGPSQDQLDFG